MPDEQGRPVFEVKVEGMKAVQEMFGKLGDELVKVAINSLEDGANKIVDSAREKHVFLGTKRVSKEEEEAAAFVFTNPDGSPRFRVRTANLRNSIQAGAPEIKLSESKVVLKIKAGMEYAEDVEFGGPGRRAFPFLIPALELNASKLIAYMTAKVTEAVNKYGGKS